MSPGALLLALGLMAAPSPAEDPAPLRAGIGLVEAGDLEGAVAALQEAVRALEQERAPGPTQARAHLYLAMAYLGLGALDTARDHMRAVWRHHPALVLHSREYAPPVIALHQAARPPAPPAARARAHQLPALVGLGAVSSVAGVALATGEAGRGAAPAPPPPAEAPGTLSLSLSNCDDECHASVNGVEVRVVGLALSSGRVDLAPFLHEGPNEIAFELVNRHGGIAYTFEVRAGERLLFQESCGEVLRVGCENDRRYPPGPARRYVYTLFQREERGRR
jgi:hypothetical protein